MTESTIAIIALIAIALALAMVATANANLVNTIVKGRRQENEILGVMCEQLKERDLLCLKVQTDAFDRQWALTDKAYIQEILQNRGDGAIVQSPEEYLDRMLRHFEENLQITREEAARWLVQNIAGNRAEAV